MDRYGLKIPAVVAAKPSENLGGRKGKGLPALLRQPAVSPS